MNIYRKSDIPSDLAEWFVPAEIGLEQTPAEYVARLVDVFREVRRVLRDDGTVFLNLGDSYATQGGSREYGSSDNGNGRGPAVGGVRSPAAGLKPKDLVGIPWRVAFALQDDGWWLRSDIIWAKPNPMPESVTDRPTKAHEYVFLLTKSPRYFWDAEAVKESSIRPGDIQTFGGSKARNGDIPADDPRYRNGSEQWGRTVECAPTRNIRTVWDIATQPYSGAHFATMPTEIPRRCIRAGTSERGCCPACGAPWRRVVERSPMEVRPGPSRDERSQNGQLRTQVNGTMTKPPQSTTTGWQPTCDCDAGEPVPCIVLDPFGGSGTTAAVAIEQGRDAVICELNPAYVELARRRIQDVAPLLSVEATA